MVADGCLPVDVQQVVAFEQWSVYKSVIRGAREADVPFALGGALALGTYTGKFRNTKDIDLYILKRDRARMVQVMSGLGLTDYYETLPYDRDWIYRGYKDGVIVDAIWEMANHHAEVDERWIKAGPTVEIDGEVMHVLPPEELIWSKLYVLQRDRCDWPDVLNLIHAAGPAIDWRHLIQRVGNDRPLLKGVLSVFSWICPRQARALPSSLWQAIGLPRPEAEEEVVSNDHTRADLLDSRPWLCPAAERAA